MTTAHDGQLTVKILVLLSSLQCCKVNPRSLLNIPIYCFTQTQLRMGNVSHFHCIDQTLCRSLLIRKAADRKTGKGRVQIREI